MKSQLNNSLKIIFLSAFLSFGITYALAWTAPASTPPTGNVSAPLNTSATTQAKNGLLNVGDIGTNSVLFADGSIQTTAAGGGLVGYKRINAVSGTTYSDSNTGLVEITFDLSGLQGGAATVGWVFQVNGTTVNSASAGINYQVWPSPSYSYIFSPGGTFTVSMTYTGFSSIPVHLITIKKFAPPVSTAGVTGTGLGYGQVWNNVTSGRVLGSTYTNSSTNPIMVMIDIVSGGNNPSAVSLNVGGMVMHPGCGAYNGSSIAGWCPLSFVVPPSSTYSLTISGGRFDYWYELK